MAFLRAALVALSALAVGVVAQDQCMAYGVDFSHGGTYNIDATSNEFFSFYSVFMGCNDETITPTLKSPGGNTYVCSDISLTPSGDQMKSECGIPFSAMTDGEWTIEIMGQQIAVRRVINLIVSVPETTYITVTPTVVEAVTSTMAAITMFETIVNTQTLILPSSTLTTQCGDGSTPTVTSYYQGQTVFVTETLTRTETEGQVTSYGTTTETTTAYCHYPNKVKRTMALEDRQAAPADVTTITVTAEETVTSVQSTVVPGTTTTEIVVENSITTITPPPRTVCNDQANPTVTVTVIPPGGSGPITQTNIVYTTTHLAGTVWVGQTEYTTISDPVSASACWRAGGWYGR